MKKIIIIDTETTPCDVTIEKVDPNNMLCYDISYIVCEINGAIIERKSFVNEDVFYDEEELMKNAFYYDKVPQYIEQIKRNETKVKNLYCIRKSILDDIEKYDIEEVYAHNMLFDYGALNNTQRWITKSKYRYFFPKNIKICDSLQMSRDVLKHNKDYRKFCEDNGYLTKNNRLRFTAEIIYRFLSQNNDFVEEHKGLEDVLIEKTIIDYCYLQDIEMRIALFE